LNSPDIQWPAVSSTSAFGVTSVEITSTLGIFPFYDPSFNNCKPLNLAVRLHRAGWMMTILYPMIMNYLLNRLNESDPHPRSINFAMHMRPQHLMKKVRGNVEVL
jgi:hypothetical protein